MSQLTSLVSKLGHNFEEVRSRALYTVISKLDYGLISEHDLVDKDNLFKNLVKWFHFENSTCKEDVLKLILRLLKHEGSDASVQLLRADPGLAQLRELTDCDVLVQDIVNLALKQVNSARYAKSENSSLSNAISKTTNFSKTSRNGKAKHSNRNLHSARSSGPKVSSRSNVQETSSRPKSGQGKAYKEIPSARTEVTIGSLSSENKNDSTPRTQQGQGELETSVIWSLPWVSLVASNLHIIISIEDSLKTLNSVSSSCQFFTTVLFQDFPPEVFLQHSGVIRQLVRLLKKPSPVNTAVVECLLVFTRLLHNQMIFCSQLEFTSQKSQEFDNVAEDAASQQPETNDPQGVVHQYQQEGYLSSSSDQQSVSSRTPEPLTIPQFCLITMNGTVELLGRVQQATPLMLCLLNLLRAVMPNMRSIWENKLQHSLVPVHKLLHSLLKSLYSQIEQSVAYEPVIELHVVAVSLHIVETLVPTDFASTVLPTELQEIICFSLVDPLLAINYPQLHATSLSYANILKCKGFLVYKDVSTVTNAMKASVKFNQEANLLPTSQALDLFQEALPALPIHQELSLIKDFANCLLERDNLGNKEIERAANLTRSLLAHAEKTVMTEAYRVFHEIVASSLGPRKAVSDLDPCPKLQFLLNTVVLLEIVCHGVRNSDNQISENAEDMLVLILKCQMLVSERSWQRVVEQLVPVLPMLQCHASKNSLLGRTTLNMLNPDVASAGALSSLQVLSGNIRLLLHKDHLCREEAATRLLWLTKLSHLPHKQLADICLLDVAITGHTPVTGMYEVGSVVRVLEVLSAPCVEPRVKQSALTQLSVMLEDSRLHQMFIEEHGVELFLNIFKNIVEELNEDASCLVIPIIATLKHLARHNSSVRQTLAQQEDFLVCVLKSLFQLSEWRLQRDATQLLALVLYADFVLSSASTLSLPHLVVESLCLPFTCQAHWTVSPNTTSSLKGVVLGHMGAERLLALQWAVLKEGLDSILQLSEVPMERRPLTLSERALRQVQHSHVVHNCLQLLYGFQNATSHNAATQALDTLVYYFELNWLVDPVVLSALPWKTTFRRFLLTPPSSQDDFSLLLAVLKFLHKLLGVCSDQSGWVSEALQTKPHTLLQMIVSANSAHLRDDNQEMWKKICQCLLDLCKLCVKQGSTDGWQILVQLILRCLDQSPSQHFYSLALLDSKLDCLLTAANQHTTNSNVLWQLLSSFHCSLPHSFMGLSITRRTLLCLNKLLNLTQEWERKWLMEHNLSWLPTILLSRDVLVKALVLQLMSGLARSVRGAGTVLQVSPELFDSVLRIVVDQAEASVVREHAAILLANILKNLASKEFTLSAQRFNLYHVFQESVSLVALSPPTSHTDPSSDMLYTHPRFIKAGCWLIYNLLASSAEDILPLITSSGLSATLCRTLMEVRKLDNCELVSLFTSICKLLTLCSSSCEVIQLQDCLPALTCILDPANFFHDVKTKEVMYLWQESLRLLSAVLTRAHAEFVLPGPVVNTLCQCIAETTSTTLKNSALLAVPSLTKYLTPQGEEMVCKALLSQWPSESIKAKSPLLSALAALLGHSPSATDTALSSGLLPLILTTLQQIHLTLTVQTSSIDKLNKSNPSLCQLVLFLTLLTNFLFGSDGVKQAAAQSGMADVIHKLWLWCQVDAKYIHLALDLLITFTADCPNASQTMVLTSNLSGIGQRKLPTSHSLVHALVSLLTKEQHPFSVYSKTLTLLSHCCQSRECRTVIAKSALLAKWADLWADKRQVQEEVEFHWLRFILIFTSTQEGQTVLPKTGDLFNQLICCAESGRPSSRTLAIAVLRNLAAYPANKPRFLSYRPSLLLLGEKLLSGSSEEKRDAALILWALAANHQKAKVMLRGLGLVSRLQLVAATSQDEVFPFVADLLKPR